MKNYLLVEDVSLVKMFLADRARLPHAKYSTFTETMCVYRKTSKSFGNDQHRLDGNYSVLSFVFNFCKQLIIY